MYIRNPGEYPVFGGLPLLYRWLNTGALNTKQDTKDAAKQTSTRSTTSLFVR
jgi:hypothetical protein